VLDLKTRLDRLRIHLGRLLESPTDELGRWGRMAVYQIRLWRFCGRQLGRDRLLTVAGDLTFKTLVGLIPLLVLVLMIVGFFSRGPEVGEGVQKALFKALNITEISVAVDGKAVGLAERIEDLVKAAGDRIDTATTAVIGVVFLLVLAMNVLGTIESAMNRIWQVRQGRPIWRRAAIFWTVLTLGPLAIVLAISVSDAVAARASALESWTRLEVVGPWLVSLGAVWFTLFIMYKLIPNVAVRSRAALSGAVVAGTLWHVIAKWAFFGLYLRYAIAYGTVFGSLAVVPLFFLWIYVTWVFALFGCELAYVIQNFSDLARAEADQGERRQSRFLAADFVALQVAGVVARRFLSGQGPAPLDLLVEATGVSRANLQELISRMEKAGLLVRSAPGPDEEDQAGYLPARDPARIRLAEVAATAAAYLPVPINVAYMPMYRKVRTAYEGMQRGAAERGGAVSLADLVAGVDEKPA